MHASGGPIVAFGHHPEFRYVWYGAVRSRIERYSGPPHSLDTKRGRVVFTYLRNYSEGHLGGWKDLLRSIYPHGGHGAQSLPELGCGFSSWSVETVVS